MLSTKIIGQRKQMNTIRQRARVSEGVDWMQLHMQMQMLEMKGILELKASGGNLYDGLTGEREDRV